LLFVTALEKKESSRGKGGVTTRLEDRGTKRPDDTTKPYDEAWKEEELQGRPNKEIKRPTEEARMEGAAARNPFEPTTERPTEGMKWLMEASPSIPSSALQAPPTLDPLPPSLASSTADADPPITYECVVPQVLYQDMRVERALNLFYTFLLGNGVPIKLQKTKKMSLAMTQIPLLPLIVSSTAITTLTKSIQVAYDKAEIPGGYTMLILHPKHVAGVEIKGSPVVRDHHFQG
jgi:hypothetical protein